MKKLISASLILVLSTATFYAQKITDGSTVDLNGLAVTYNVLNKESVIVGGKSFDRYKVSATLVNNSGESINMRLSNAHR
ncbi:hypothetical protein [Chryseobacterium indoltheticum]|uniref:Uncharacterized protein n=1 Tax=Chryseobacterium indoltheticum TaxID=254 RepID=A0A381FHX2_9FLAO|nr:hypothetical protein [Chryseobacterium indoltheticum]SUX46068.1 Uncharacterised protein [Chryseobacterium indoltheticum]